MASLMHSGYAFVHYFTNPSKILRLDVFFMLYPYILCCIVGGADDEHRPAEAAAALERQPDGDQTDHG